MEQPISVKGLRLLTTSISIVFILIIATLAYSGYQEVTYLTQSLRQQTFGQAVVINSTHISIKGLEIQNRGVYPLTLALAGEIALEEFSLGSSSAGPLAIRPGGVGKVNFTLPLKFDQAFGDPNLVRKLLFNSTVARIRFRIIGGMQPFFTGTISGSLNNSVGPVLEGLSLKIGDISLHNETHVKIPLAVEFLNKSPFLLNASLSALVVSAPQKSALGSYGYGSAVLSVFPGQNIKESLTVYLVKEAAGKGSYTVELRLTSEEFTHAWRVMVEG